MIREAIFVAFGILAVAYGCAAAESDSARTPSSFRWEQCGWGGGGFFWASAFHPANEGTIYLAGDVNGVAKTTDSGRNWRLINNGIASYGVFSLAVDRTSPDTVYAATEDGLCKSIDAGEHWSLLPGTGPKELRLTGEKLRSVRSVAVDPSDGRTVYATSPLGKIGKSVDGGQTWKVIYQQGNDERDTNAMSVRFGSNTPELSGGVWWSTAFPDATPQDRCVGVGVSLRVSGAKPQKMFLLLRTATGHAYASKNAIDAIAEGKWHDLVVRAEDLTPLPEYSKNREAGDPSRIDWTTVNRIDVTWVGTSPSQATYALFEKAFVVIAATEASREKPSLVATKSFGKLPDDVRPSGNARIGEQRLTPIPSVAVSSSDSAFVIAATHERGLIVSHDGGLNWQEAAETPKKAAAVAFTSDPQLIYATFYTDGVWRSLDGGKSWAKCPLQTEPNVAITDIVASSVSPRHVYAIGTAGWNGTVFASRDGGETWVGHKKISPDFAANPTLPQDLVGGAMVSAPTNIAISPVNPQHIYVSANWRPFFSDNGGATWTERVRGADISCVTDIRFKGDRAYVTAMDEGTLVSEDNGKSWKQLWPLKYDPELGGHNWRVDFTKHDGVEYVISTVSPWLSKHPPRVVVSPDGGETFKVVMSGLPDYVIRPNTMWGMGHPRALAVDPNQPGVAYLGIDGDAADGRSGGGIFKSVDGGLSWMQLANQPGSRRMFNGLSIDPMNSKRLYWAACGTGGGLYRTDDGGVTWQLVFSKETWLWNVVTTPDGKVYCGGRNLWCSEDHGATWKPLTDFRSEQAIVAIEQHPTDPRTLWIGVTTWNNSAQGGVFKTTDGGATWTDITGDIPCRKPRVLRFNPATQELWAGWVGLYKLKQ